MVKSSTVRGSPVVDDSKTELKLLQGKFDDLQRKYNELQKQNSKLLNDNRALKNFLDISMALNLSKDMKIYQLQSNQDVTGSQVSNGSKQMLFQDYEEYFSAEQLKELRSHEKGKRRNTGFITKCIELIYQDNVAIIGGKVSGDRSLKGKTPISPVKKKLIDAMLVERVRSEGICES